MHDNHDLSTQAAPGVVYICYFFSKPHTTVRRIPLRLHIIYYVTYLLTNGIYIRASHEVFCSQYYTHRFQYLLVFIYYYYFFFLFLHLILFKYGFFCTPRVSKRIEYNGHRCTGKIAFYVVLTSYTRVEEL